LSFKDAPKLTVSKELAIKAICNVLVDTNPIIRLFEDQLDDNKPFSHADKIVWELHDSGSNNYSLITSDYWINKEDFKESEFSGAINLFEEEDED